MLGNRYVVEDGLMDGEEIVTHGAFSVDASAQLEGKPSMMNPKNGQTNSLPGMDMPENSKPKDNKSLPAMDIPASAKPAKNNSPVVKISAASIQKSTFKVSGNCDMCKDRIEEAAKSVKGVSIAGWNVKTKIMDIEYNSKLTSVEAIQRAIARAGHDTGKYKASDKVYTSLPTCCLYRK
jgi:Cu(I)/Ag(I) efflux system membrane fusion protein